MAIGASEAETFWVEFPRKLKRRGLAGVKLVISFGRFARHHQGLRATLTLRGHQGGGRAGVPRDLAALPWWCNALAHAGKSDRRRVVSAFIATAFAQDHADAARAQCRQVADQVRPLHRFEAVAAPAPTRVC